MKMYIGIDLGTSSAKLMLVDEQGLIINSIKKTYPVFHPEPNWSEQNPEDWFEAIKKGIVELIEHIDRDTIFGIACAGQMHGLVTLDEFDQVIRPAILWNDGRTQKETDQLNQDKEFLFKEVSNIAFSGFTLPKLIWLAKNEPEHFKRIDKIVLPKDYIVYRLTGVHITDYSDASGTLLLSVEHGEWSQTMANQFKIPLAALPKIKNANEVIGELNKDLAQEWGIKNKVKIVAGAADNASSAIGNGVVYPGECNLSLGTSGTLFVPIAKHQNKIQEAVHNFSLTKDTYHLLTCVLSAASCNQWWIENILHTEDYASEFSDLDNIISKKTPYFLPYLMGERSPHNDTEAKSLFIGMTPETTRNEMTLSLLEGVAFAMRDSLETMKQAGANITKARLSGGGAKVKVWQKVLSSVLDIELETLSVDEGAAYGAAILAMSGDLNKPIKEITDRIISVKGLIKPDRNLVKYYDERYQIYVKLYPALKDIMKLI